MSLPRTSALPAAPPPSFANTDPRPLYFDVILLGGDVPWRGGVWVRHNDIWGPVCGNGWGSDNAAVVCDQIGFVSAGAGKARGTIVSQLDKFAIPEEWWAFYSLTKGTNVPSWMDWCARQKRGAAVDGGRAAAAGGLWGGRLHALPTVFWRH